MTLCHVHIIQFKIVLSPQWAGLQSYDRIYVWNGPTRLHTGIQFALNMKVFAKYPVSNDYWKYYMHRVKELMLSMSDYDICYIIIIIIIETFVVFEKQFYRSNWNKH